MNSLYSPYRLWSVFRLLLSFYLLLKKRESFLGISPLSPEKLAATITELGASFIKLAQVLATRNDFFDEPYLDALKTLHDDLPPMAPAAYERVMAKAFPTLPFIRFNPQPIASASIGQVHEAWLDEDTKVAVKLRREGIEKRVRADIRILSLFNRLFKPLFSHTTRHSIESVIAEFSTMIVKECSLNQERMNLEKFSLMYADAGIIFPKSYGAFSCDDALVMSFEEGWRFDDRTSILSGGFDIKSLIDKLVRFYTDQMLVKGFFHADPHPGNLLVNPDGKLVLLDFGMVKRVPNDTRIAIIELIRAANERDFEAYVSAAKRLGTVAYDAPAAELAEFTERMFDIFGNDALDSGSMQKLAFDVLEQTRNLPFKLPQEAIYILRVSAIVEGLGTTYIENFNGIKDILPILQSNIPRALGMKESILETLIDEIKHIPDDITALRYLIRRASKGELQVELSPLQYDLMKKELRNATAPLYMALILLLGVLGSWMAGMNEIAYVLLGAAMMRLWYR
ncbi:MAG: AarF/UbiB family protein [Sulfuricurvum sp.]|uniref:ABC1 kinase family protein n=1 Tax=Sulfuricurvum sp. TaxID=2025608 RepID=UPI0026276DDF|nr:AarF/UbiB family protein [Sulfuricurvum sp.]MDD2370074.1 AarF/UbiB family protein [Sulfuricurvum sp.]MDD2950697.1 AarF/UbiB family protein [Sulfuricurvum sp.]MDD5118936.1 AarF/UbiB family protein [Sulfuricurvum sp.]